MFVHFHIIAFVIFAKLCDYSSIGKSNKLGINFIYTTSGCWLAIVGYGEWLLCLWSTHFQTLSCALVYTVLIFDKSSLTPPPFSRLCSKPYFCFAIVQLYLNLICDIISCAKAVGDISGHWSSTWSRHKPAQSGRILADFIKSSYCFYSSNLGTSNA